MEKKVIIGVLNWGLGHATRIIPIVEQYRNDGWKVYIASDGEALQFLKKQFPDLVFIELPSYNVRYTKGKNLMAKMLFNTGKIFKGIREERKILNELCLTNKFDLIISDNRFGFYSPKSTSVYITHQTNIIAGVFSGMANKLHHYFINKFDELWIPDFEGEDSLAGILSQYKGSKTHKYIGPLSRFKKSRINANKNTVLIVVSGPEPQKTIFENIARREMRNCREQEIVLVCGRIEENVREKKIGKNTIINYLESKDLEELMAKSKIVISRSGYSSIMDYHALGKKAFLIPTPGQFEQEYLAQRLKDKGICDSSDQNKFNLQNAINSAENFCGFS